MNNRVLLALDMLDEAALEAAVEIARLRSASLEGLYVEDTDLLRLAALPFAAEIAVTSAAARRLELVQLERELRAHATALRRQVEHQATRSQLEWSFSVTRGSRLTATLTNAQSSQVCVLGRPASFAAASGTKPGPVMVLFDGTPTARRALETAAAIIEPTGDLTIAITSDTAEQITANCQMVRELTAPLAPAPRIQLTGGPDETARTARTRHAALLLLGADTVTDTTLLGRLQKSAGCPLVIVR